MSLIRDIDRLTARTFDVLVVGGGIYGLTVAYDAAQRGLSVALIERDDFGSGTSFNHLRTIHGGLRYLQTLDLARSRESVRERRALARIAPHALRTVPFSLPLYRSLTRGRAAMRAGFLLDRLVSADRNRGIPAALHLPAGRVVSRAAALERFPGLGGRGITGAAVWHDYVTTEADRLTFAWAWAAAEQRAMLANHVEAVAPLLAARRVVGVRATDAMTGRTVEIGARVTVNATGAAIDRLLAPAGTTGGISLLRAMNLVTCRPAGDEALGGRSAAGRHLFLVPWRGRALFGTWESPRPCRPEDTAPGESEIAAFITELNEAFPGLALTMDEVTLVHRGLVPAVRSADGGVTLEGRERVRDHADEGIDGIVSVAGAKYTTARAVAERVTDQLLRKLGRAPVPCQTASTPLPGGQLASEAAEVASDGTGGDAPLAVDALPHLVAAYGSRYREVLNLARERPAWRARLDEGSPVIAAQLVWAVRHEMAMTLADAVIRRTPLGALGYPGDATAARSAEIIGAELGWSGQTRAAEIDRLRRFYAIPPI